MNSEQFSFAGRFADPKKNLHLLRIVVWLVTIGVGFVQAWASRFFLSPDASNYLDIASAYLRGDWKNAVNAYWSPFFSWLLALSFGVFRPSPYWDSTILHLLNFAGLLVSLWAFEFFFCAFLRLRALSRGSESAEAPLPALAWWAFGYALFLSTSLLVLTVINTTPDVWVAVWTYLAMGLLLRIRMAGGNPYLFAALGFVLGCAYFTKAFYFPMSFVFLITAWLCAGNPRKTARYAFFGFAAFLLFAGPWVAVLSRAKDRFTFGDTGKMNFAMMIDQIPRPALWRGENATGTPKHPVRLLLSKPLVYEFATPISGTYPPGYDWSYWMDGVRPHFSLSGFVRVLRQSAGTFFQIWLLQIECSVALLAFFLAWHRPPSWIRVFFREWYLWAPPLIACLAYAIVHVEPRLVAPFVLLCWVVGFFSLLVAAEVPQSVALALALAVLSITGLRIAKSAVSDIVAILSKQQNVDWEVAEGLKALGLQSHNRVSVLSLPGDIHWARSAGLTIVSEIPLGEEAAFWATDAAGKERVFQVLAETGARMVVTKNPPPGATKEGWVPLSRTGYYAYRLPILDRQHP